MSSSKRFCPLFPFKMNCPPRAPKCDILPSTLNSRRPEYNRTEWRPFLLVGDHHFRRAKSAQKQVILKKEVFSQSGTFREFGRLGFVFRNCLPFVQWKYDTPKYRRVKNCWACLCFYPATALCWTVLPPNENYQSAMKRICRNRQFDTVAARPRWPNARQPLDKKFCSIVWALLGSANTSHGKYSNLHHNRTWINLRHSKPHLALPMFENSKAVRTQQAL